MNYKSHFTLGVILFLTIGNLEGRAEPIDFKKLPPPLISVPSSSPKSQLDSRFVLNISEDGTLSADDPEITFDQFITHLIQFKRENPDSPVFLNTHPEANVGALLKTLELLQSLTIKNVAIVEINPNFPVDSLSPENMQSSFGSQEIKGEPHIISLSAQPILQTIFDKPLPQLTPRNMPIGKQIQNLPSNCKDNSETGNFLKPPGQL